MVVWSVMIVIKSADVCVYLKLRPFMCPYCQKTFKTSVNCKKHMKTHRQELALLGHATNAIGADNDNLPTANETTPVVANVSDNMTYTQEVELIEVSCPTDVHLNEALQATQLGNPPQYQPTGTGELDQSNMVQQPTVIHDYRNSLVTDLQLQNVFATQVC